MTVREVDSLAVVIVAAADDTLFRLISRTASSGNVTFDRSLRFTLKVATVLVSSPPFAGML